MSLCRGCFIAIFSLLFLAFSPSALAQFAAAVQGTVVDTSGATVPGAQVTLTNQATGVSQIATTSAEGFYKFASLPPGSYTVKVEAKGFEAQTISDVDVSAELVRGLDVQLKLGSVSQSVEVNASQSPTLQSEDASISGTLTNQEVEALPSFARDPYELLRFSPGVLGDDARSGLGRSVGFPNGPGANGGTGGPGGSNTALYQTENQQSISANGERITSNDYMVDGVSVNSLQWGGAAVITPSGESVQEITVLSNDYDAADGRNSGAHIKVVTKGGTNEFHGAGFFQYQTPGLNAYNKFNGYNFGAGTYDPTVRDQDAYRQFGGDLGGPIMKDRLFFFFDYEGLRDKNTTYQNQWVDTPQFDSLLADYSPDTPVAITLTEPGIAPRVKQVLPASCATFPVPCQLVGNAVNIGSPTGAYGTYLSGAAQGTCPNNIECGAGLTTVPEFEFAQIYLPQTTSGNQYNARVGLRHGTQHFHREHFFHAL